MNDSDLIWLAGLLEGEGSFLAGPPSAPKRPRITVHMTDREIIERVARLFQVKYASLHRHEQHPEWSPTYSVTLRGQRAQILMLQLRPHMGTRRQGQIDKALAGYKTHGRGPGPKKLDANKAREIRASTEKVTLLARRYGVSRTTVRRIQQNVIWRE